MNNDRPMEIVKDLANKRMTITRFFDADPDQVWRAWTESAILDLWWAPKPYRAETKSHDFRNGGHWLYAMVGPDQSRMYARADYSDIVEGKSFRVLDSFCDENGNAETGFPGMKWFNQFLPDAQGSKVIIELHFKDEATLNSIIEMGFQEGFTAAMSNLDLYLETQFKLRKEGKKSKAARVTTYLNFPGTTEEAFLFYKNVFHGSFTGVGLRRFGDIEMPAGSPVMSTADKKLIIHAELTIMAGHVLMATDSPESMGFSLEQGNNMHINVEPESKEETKRLFDALSDGGNITMPLSDMFWGAYFGTFTDRFGINWMLNYQEGS